MTTRRVTFASLASLCAFGMTFLAACSGTSSHGVTEAPASAPYVQRLAADGFKLQKAGTLTDVTPSAAKLSEYFSGAALGTNAGREELVLQIRPSASKIVHLIEPGLAKSAASKGYKFTEDGDLAIVQGPYSKTLSDLFG